MRVKPNMYVRTIDGVIAKVVDNQDDEIVKTDDNTTHLRCHIIKARRNIIDLIEVGDYVNGFKVISLWKDKGKVIGVAVDGGVIGFDDCEIKSIVTKEQFESMEYTVDGNNE